MRVRTLRPNELHQAATVLAAAFAQEPIVLRMVPAEARNRLDRITSYFRWSLRTSGYDNVDVVLGDSHNTILGVAIWEPPTHKPHTLSAARELPSVWRSIGRTGFKELAAYESAVAPYSSNEPHWYLVDIGSSPEARGQGVGRVLLEHRLRSIDAAAQTTALTATTPGSRNLYERHGFKVMHEVRIGPKSTLSLMSRAPGTSAGTQPAQSP